MIKNFLFTFLFSYALFASYERTTIVNLIEDIKKIKVLKTGETSLSKESLDFNEMVKKRVIAVLNLNTMIKKSLGSHYSKLTRSEITRFEELFKKLMLQNLSRSSGGGTSLGKNNLINQYTVNIMNEVETNGDIITVKSLLAKKGEESTEVKYLFQNKKIIDLFIDDESLTANFFEQFSEVIAESGFTGLIKLMEENIKKK